jgi:hypothetical protein
MCPDTERANIIQYLDTLLCVLLSDYRTDHQYICIYYHIRYTTLIYLSNMF